MKPLFIVGYMGSGKSTLGKWLARKWGCSWVDLDAVIEKNEGTRIPEIFEKKGEAYFRELESLALKRYDTENIVVSTGGGTPCYFDNMDWMNAVGITVYLKASPEFLMSRLENSENDRPLLEAQIDKSSFIKRQLMEREPYYEKAQITVSAMKAKKELLDKWPEINRDKL